MASDTGERYHSPSVKEYGNVEKITAEWDKSGSYDDGQGWTVPNGNDPVTGSFVRD